MIMGYLKPTEFPCKGLRRFLLRALRSMPAESNPLLWRPILLLQGHSWLKISPSRTWWVGYLTTTWYMMSWWNKPHSVHEAIDLVQWHESCKGAQRRKVAVKQVRADPSSPEVDSPRGSVRRVDSKPYVTEERLLQFSQSFKNDLVKELKRFCQPNHDQRLNYRGQQRRNSGRHGSSECYNCHELGHLAREWPQRKMVYGQAAETSVMQLSN